MSGDLNTRATAVFEWRAGMAFYGGHDDDACGRVYRYPGPGCCGENGAEVSDLTGALMDTTDPGNLGHMERQLADELGAPDLCVLRVPGGFRVYTRWECPIYGTFQSKAEALIAAMETAKAREVTP